MAIIRKALEQIKAEITPEEIAEFRAAVKRGPTREQLKDQDALTPTRAMWRRAFRSGRPPVDSPKSVVSFRADADVVRALRMQPGWSGQINKLSREWLVGIGALPGSQS